MMSKQMLSSELLLELQARHPQALQITGEGFQQALLAEPGSLLQILEVLKTGPKYQFNLLSNLTAVDYLEYFEIVYHLYSLPLKQAVTVKTRCSSGQAEVFSVVSLWPSANFQEREIYDLLGIRFSGHPDLRRIFMPDEFTEHPLRKSYTFIPTEEEERAGRC